MLSQAALLTLPRDLGFHMLLEITEPETELYYRRPCPGRKRQTEDKFRLCNRFIHSRA